MSLSCYGLCYHNSNKENFKSSLQSCQPKVNYGRYDVSPYFGSNWRSDYGLIR
ncbi:Uncharacterised protein [Citrobacter koseri]|nr:Uncharacterised protein [Citrobacter koseri]STT20355.1 Uncharacterised protein [Citrobacter koseri]